MGSGLEDIISRLEQQRSAIESALTALRDLGGSCRRRPTLPGGISACRP